MNFQEAVSRACEEPTLLKALSWIAIWESERIIPTAHRFLNGEIEREINGNGWNSCFEFLFREVMEQYTVKKLKGQ